MTGRLRARGWTAGRRAIIEGWASDPPATADELRERVVAFYAERSGADQKPLKNVRVRDAVRRLGEGLHQVLLTHEHLGDFGGEPVEGVVRAELGPVAVQGRPLRFDCVRHIDDRVDLVVVPADVRLFESIEIASVLAVGDQCLPKRREDRLREHGVVQTAWRPRLIRTVELGGVTRSVERGDRVLVDSDVVRVTVPAFGSNVTTASGRSRRMISTSDPTTSFSSAFASAVGLALSSVPSMPESRYPSMVRSSTPSASAAARSSPSRT